MTEPETVARLAALVETREPFVHVRFGDGDVFFATGTGPVLTADGEEWSGLLQQRLLHGWLQLEHADRLLVGDVETYDVSDGCEREWRLLRRMLEQLRAKRRQPDAELVHIEALRAGRGHALPFYQAVAADDRRKVFVGPERLAGAARMLGAEHLPVPLRVAHEGAYDTADAVAAAGYEVALFAAGRGGKIMQGRLAAAAPGLTQIDVGSGLDLLFGGVRRGTDAGVDVEKVLARYRAGGLDA